MLLISNVKQVGAVEARRAHNPEVPRSKLGLAKCAMKHSFCNFFVVREVVAEGRTGCIFFGGKGWRAEGGRCSVILFYFFMLFGGA